MNRPRLLFLIPSLAGGGAERVAATLIPFFAEQYELTVVLLENRCAYPLPPAVNVIALSGERSGVASHLLHSPLHLFRLTRLLRREKPDIVLSFMEQANLLNCLLKRRFGYRAVISQRVDPRRQYAGKGLLGKAIRWLSRRLYPRADHVVTISEGLRHILLEDYALLAERVTTINNPVQCSRLAEQARELLPPKMPERFLLHVGRMDVPVKGQDILLNAFARIAEAIPDLSLVLVGDGSDRETIRRQAATLGLESRVYFAGWQDNVAAWMVRAELFLFASRWEGLGNVLLEALACGCPVISTDCPSGPREILDNGLYGLLVPVDDVEALADAALALLADTPRRELLRIKGRARAEQFDATLIAKNYSLILNKESQEADIN